ncbi:chemotaxis protein CheW [Chenggangzhangella methanolivorans]|uniref:Chemotaxis protein CheA n=1 Tax=Chenggangzhangella methanolivorans TaxID=1437009 RepID=A0A9E6UP21_9HYPH|nr:chemotaxis protein CheW [Chenggangzhangella methanolivorans]QZN99254.1 chemotaxis protein CheW [Chenggangzhangella methanolivorans]
MDDLLKDFLTETAENLDLVDVELVRFEQEPENEKILGNIFRLVHTVKGTCGFLGLPRLEALAHAAETLMGKFRSGALATPDAVTLILGAIDRIKDILAELERSGAEPLGDDQDLICELDVAAANAVAAPKAEPGPGRPLKPGEVSLEELERAFLEAEGPDLTPANDPEPAAAAAPKPVEMKPAEAKPAASEEVRDGSVAGQTIRVGVDTLDRLMTMVSELVLTRNQLMTHVRRRSGAGAADDELTLPLQRLTHVTAELQEGVMKTRMQPIGAAWRALPRLVRDLAADLGKKIELVTAGADAELDRQVLDLIKDPLTHMVRNCADHGLETPAERVMAGKPETGTIRLEAFHQGGYVVVEIGDDGRGLDVARIKKKALANGLASEAEIEKMTEAQVLRFIFAPGFSTAEAVTSVSGRGVGMDVVRSNIEQIGGSIDLRSVAGQGATVVIRIPLTLAIIPALTVGVGGEVFAIPQLAVRELVHVGGGGEHRIERIGDAPLLRLRDRLLPLVRLAEVLGQAPGQATGAEPAGGENFIVVAQAGEDVFGVVVDDVLHTEEIVVKPMASRLKEIPLFAGATILGDGSVILILDPNGVAQALGPAREVSAARAAETVEAMEADDKIALLTFRAGGQAPKAVPLALVTRLEIIDAATIETANGRMMVQYRGALMPLVPASHDVVARTAGDQPLLVFVDDGRSVGLIVDEILDIVEDRMEISVASDIPGALGAATVAGRATEILDVAHFLTLAFDDWLKRKDRPSAEQDRPSVLLVDDSAFFRNMLTPVLTAAGYRVTAVEGGAAALGLIRLGRRYDVVVSDIEMPEMDGYALAGELRGEPLAAETPMLALSSLTGPSVVARAQEAGFSDYVAKFDRPGLISALTQLAPGYRSAA